MSKKARKVKIATTHDQTSPAANKDVQEYRLKRRNFVYKIDQIIQRQGSEEDGDIFGLMYSLYGLLEPRYPFANLYSIYEESDVLRSCIDAMVDNIDGCTYDFDFLGDDFAEKNNPELQAQHQKLKDFFDNVNEEESFTVLRKKVRRDLEVTGNAAVEVIRNVKGEIEMIYHTPIMYLRMTELQKDPIRVDRSVPRDGKLIPVKVNKQFRRFARLTASQGGLGLIDKRSPEAAFVTSNKRIKDINGEYVLVNKVRPGSNKITWFKEFGDPRTLDADTGKYVESTANKATEIWWLKIPLAGYSYGAPRWIGAIKTIKGRCLAEFVNYDIFLNQGIPPIAVKVSGGRLSDASWDDIENGFEQWRDPTKFNRTLVLQVDGESDGFESGGSPKIEIEKLRDARAEEYLFENYLKYSEAAIRKVFRLPPVFVGSDDNAYASAYISQSVAEQQVFQPARFEFDEKVNMLIVRGEFGITKWKFASEGPQITGTEQFSRVINALNRGCGMSPNYVIKLANQILGTEMSLLTDPWADLPSELVKSYANQGKLKGPVLEASLQEAPIEQAIAAKNEKVTEASQNLYEAMLAVEKEIEIVEPKEITPEDYVL